MAQDLQERVAIVTGASGALGTAIGDELAAGGCRVVKVDIAGDDSDHIDATSAAGCRAMVELAIERFGRLDILVLNAGNQHVAPIDEFPESEWDRVHDLCVKGPFLAIREAWKELTSRPGGRIVATASTSSFVAEPYKVAYTSAKHALIGLIKSAAVEGGRHGLTANCVAPTWMRTPMLESQLEEQMRLRNATEDEVMASFLGNQPIQRFVDPAEVAKTIAFLAGPDSSGMTGACVPVDLGALIAP
jgi:3-hydroxybutyrate dehydrogenase